MLSTLAFFVLLIGAVLLVAGYIAEPRAVRPGWACVIIAAALFLVAYLAPAMGTYHAL